MLKLSEAIRMGAMLSPQTRLEYEDETGATCAMGAAYKAVGHNDREHNPKPWEVILAEKVNCPDTLRDCAARSLEHIIIHLNDFHDWTREQIADFVASIEVGDFYPAPAPEAQVESQESSVVLV